MLSRRNDSGVLQSVKGERGFPASRGRPAWCQSSASDKKGRSCGNIFGLSGAEVDVRRSAHGGGFNIHRTTSAACLACAAPDSARIGRNRVGAARCCVLRGGSRQSLDKDVRLGRRVTNDGSPSLASKRAHGRSFACRESHSIRCWPAGDDQDILLVSSSRVIPVVASEIRSRRQHDNLPLHSLESHRPLLFVCSHKQIFNHLVSLSSRDDHIFFNDAQPGQGSSYYSYCICEFPGSCCARGPPCSRRRSRQSNTWPTTPISSCWKSASMMKSEDTRVRRYGDAPQQIILLSALQRIKPRLNRFFGASTRYPTRLPSSTLGEVVPEMRGCHGRFLMLPVRSRGAACLA